MRFALACLFSTCLIGAPTLSLNAATNHAIASAASTSSNAPLSQAVRVQVAPVSRAPVGQQHQVIGQSAPFRHATIAAEVPGRIIERLVEPGTITKTDQLLVSIDPTRAELELRRSRAIAQAREVDLAHARHELKRGRALFEKRVISQDTLDDLGFAQRQAKAQLDAALASVAEVKKAVSDASVRAPFAGQIESVNVQVGDYVNPGQPIATLTDFSSARVYAGVSASMLSRISLGDTAQVTFDDLGGAILPGKVVSIGRVRDQVSGTYPVELHISHPDAQTLREGLVATVAWQLSNHQSQTTPLSIPASALLRTSGAISAYVIESNIAKLRSIRIGNSDGNRVQVLHGLSEGELVVTAGQFAIRDGSIVDAQLVDPQLVDPQQSETNVAQQP